jgi:hypothetical protein
VGERVGQGGSSHRPIEALRAAEVRRSASAVGGGANLLLVGTEPPYEQGLRAPGCHERGVRLCGDESLDGEAFGSLMRLFRQFRKGVLQSTHSPDPIPVCATPPDIYRGAASMLEFAEAVAFRP